MIPYVDIHSHHPGDAGTINVRSLRLGMDDPLPPAPYAAGIHPWDACAIADPWPEYEFLRHAGIAAVGEIGLDYLKGADRERQKDVFASQLEIAAERSLPVIIHCVRAFDDVMAMLGRYRSVKAVFHGYIGNTEQTVRLINSGHYISLGETSLGSTKTVAAAGTIPPERLFLETDDRPVAIERVYQTASAALGIPPDRLKESIYDNYLTLLKGK